jgi:hypothetical protein
LEPILFWEKVPLPLKAIYQFFNAPITSDPKGGQSPTRMIKQLAKVEDFVAYKLDIDHPETELPIVLDFLNDPSLMQLVDEFFFELHYRCEVMRYCGWDYKMPKKHLGIELNSQSALNIFTKLRQNGVRAHFWP